MMRTWKFLFFLFINFATTYGQAPLPRFVSIRSKIVNMHVGPGIDYPTIWQYMKQGYPLEVIAEFGQWRRVRDIDGVVGWIHKNLLSSKRTGLVRKRTHLYQEPHESSAIRAHVHGGIIVRVLNFLGHWCRVEIPHNGRIYLGWMKKKIVWGLYDKEERTPQ
jgi:SH3-like domain-containing protein